MRKLAVGFAAVAFTIAAATIALTGNANAGPTTVTRYQKIAGTFSGESAGACDVTNYGYANQCPSGNCACVNVPNATVSEIPLKTSIAGKGTAVVYITFDLGATVPSSGHGCIPFFGVANLSTTLHNVSLAPYYINLVGTECHHFGSTNHNDPISGGFGISQNPLPSNSATGFGHITGTFNKTTGVVSITLDGPVTE